MKRRSVTVCYKYNTNVNHRKHFWAVILVRENAYPREYVFNAIYYVEEEVPSGRRSRSGHHLTLSMVST